MVIPIYIGFISYEHIDHDIVKYRLEKILSFFRLDNSNFKIQYLLGQRGGLIFIDQVKNAWTVPFACQQDKRLTVSAYLPFGVPRQMKIEDMHSGRYLPEMVDKLASSPQHICHLAPPQVWADCDLEKNVLCIFNDYRGFGRLYEYTSPFGIVWTNKMAAAPMLAATCAAMDETAWAGFAANSLFYGGSTGFSNMNYVLPGTWLQADLSSGLIERRRFSSDTGGVAVEPLPASAVEESADALLGWWQDLDVMTSGPKTIDLSGGRDSRVVAAYALASNLEVKFRTCFPPALDADLAERLVNLAGRTVPFVREDSRQKKASSYKDEHSLLYHASMILRANNHDVCIHTFLNYPVDSQYLPKRTFIAGGPQGEITHTYQYDNEILNNMSIDERLSEVFDFHTTNAYGVTESTRNISRINLINPLIAKSAIAGFENSFYILDFMRLDIYLNRNSAGSVGAYDIKTPLTVYPYVRYGFSQSLKSKIDSIFVKEIISFVMPQWRDVPFFHEFPEEKRHDFHVRRPTWWELGRGKDLLEIYDSHPELWKFFEKKQVLESAYLWQQKLSSKLTPRETAFRELCNRCAQRHVWMVAFMQELKEINEVISTFSS
ncbi:hypothetical protein [Desulfovibrio sp. ZJ200]|uniref:hypothetical protein n=1 Tax=Desulfovibrio sp. ZJ200 TaxID=2709792 RepID=UPI0013EDA164|nr:hypothetical protein [Desulfovibrio sp. ZJ200]